MHRQLLLKTAHTVDVMLTKSLAGNYDGVRDMAAAVEAACSLLRVQALH